MKNLTNPTIKPIKIAMGDNGNNNHIHKGFGVFSVVLLCCFSDDKVLKKKSIKKWNAIPTRKP
jgi:hypothetical protein